MFMPIIAGSGFSWSLENGLGFPFDYHFMHMATASISFIAVLIILSLKGKIEI